MKKITLKLFGVLALGIVIFLGSCSDDDVKAEEESKEPVAAFTISSESPLAGEDISFTSSAKNAATFQWAFGDGGTSTEESPTYAYAQEGTYIVTFTVSGEEGKASMKDTITVGYPTVLFTDGIDLKIKSVVFDGSNSALDVSDYPDSTRHCPIAVSNDKSKIYYADQSTGIIYEANSDGSNQTALVTGEFTYPSNIALDKDGNLYVTERGDADSGEGAGVFKVTNAGVVTKLYGSEDGLEVPTAIAIDQSTGDIYINDVGAADLGYSADGIWQGTTSGSTIAKKINGGGYSIAVSPKAGKLYYNDAFVGENIQMVDLSTLKDPTKFADLKEPRCYGIYSLNGKVYFTDYDGAEGGTAGTVMRAEADGSNPSIIASGFMDPRGVVVF